MRKLLAKLLVVLVAPAATSATAAVDPSATQGDLRSAARAALDNPELTEAALATIAGPVSDDAEEDAVEQKIGGDFWPSIESGIQVI